MKGRNAIQNTASRKTLVSFAHQKCAFQLQLSGKLKTSTLPTGNMKSS